MEVADMNQRRLGKTEIRVPILGFGGIPIAGLGFNQAVEIVKDAYNHGIRYFDTARNYGNSEVKIGNALNGKRSECIISSKSIRRSKRETEEDVDISLKNFNTDVIDIYFAHDVSNRGNFQKIYAHDGSIQALQKVKKSGKVRYLGISCHNVNLFLEHIQMDVYDVAMIPVNIIDKDFIKIVIPAARKKGMGVIG
ncbi:aldo/keto reductase, partial [Candidatus Peregrinibacteria bacterium]|nr:aldo/keto reductase [Candidatus Peregrinibacteria bacterium]